MRSNFGLGGSVVCGLFATFALAPSAEASFARSTGQPIRAYSASLIGKKNLSQLQLQTVTADPDEPLGGSTSATFDPEVVDIDHYGWGPGYQKAAESPFQSGVGIEIAFDGSPNGKALIDLGEYFELPLSVPTGYLRVYYQLIEGGLPLTGKLANDGTFIESHPGYTSLDNDGPLGVDTHYFDFVYREMDDSVAATYQIYAADAATETHYRYTPLLNQPFTPLSSDFVITQDAPGNPLFPGGIVPFEGASVGGTVPEPAALSFAAMTLVGFTIRRKPRSIAIAAATPTV